MESTRIPSVPVKEHATGKLAFATVSRDTKGKLAKDQDAQMTVQGTELAFWIVK